MIAYLIPSALGLALMWAIVRARYPIRATLTSEGVVASRNLPESIRAKLSNFAREVLQPGDAIRLKGFTQPNGKIRFAFPRSIDRDIAQRLRNFLTNEVYMR